MSTSETQTTSRTITLKAADGSVFDVEEEVAMEFATVKSFFDENSDALESKVIPLPNVTAKPLASIIEYCKGHLALRPAGSSASPEEAPDFDQGFVKDKTNEELKEMILAANYLDIKDLLELLNQTVANRIANRSVEYVRKFFGIENDYTLEEEEKLRMENPWAFEGVDPDDDEV